MNKLPYMQFFIDDWLKDTAVLMPATRGIWIDALCAMHGANQCGELRGTVEQLARALGCLPDEMHSALVDLEQSGVAEMKRECNAFGNAIVTLINRRMNRDYKEREESKLRVKNHRKGKACNGNVTADVTPLFAGCNGNVTPLESESESESEGERRAREAVQPSRISAETDSKPVPEKPPIAQAKAGELTVAERISAEKQLKRVEMELEALKGKVSGGWELTSDDRLRRAELREAQAELKKELGWKA